MGLQDNQQYPDRSAGNDCRAGTRNDSPPA